MFRWFETFQNVQARNVRGKCNWYNCMKGLFVCVTWKSWNFERSVGSCLCLPTVAQLLYEDMSRLPGLLLTCSNVQRRFSQLQFCALIRICICWLNPGIHITFGITSQVSQVSQSHKWNFTCTACKPWHVQHHYSEGSDNERPQSEMTRMTKTGVLWCAVPLSCACCVMFCWHCLYCARVLVCMRLLPPNLSPFFPKTPTVSILSFHKADDAPQAFRKLEE